MVLREEYDLICVGAGIMSATLALGAGMSSIQSI